MITNCFYHSERVLFLPISENDVDILMESMNDKDVRILARSRRDILNEGNTKELILKYQKEEESFIIYEKENNIKIGYGFVMDIDLYNKEASLALVIGKKDYRGKGYGRESIELLMKHAFIGLNLESIYLEVNDYNIAGIKLYEKVGFKYVGKRRNGQIVGNKKYDVIIMDMIAEEYFSRYGNNEVEQIVNCEKI